MKILAAGSAVYGLRAALASRDWAFRVEAATDHGHLIHEAAAADRCDGDIIIIPAAMVGDLAAKSKLVAGSQMDVGKTGIGYAVRSGHAVPVIGNVTSLLQAVRECEKLYLTTAPTGEHMQAALKKADLGDVIAGKLRLFDRATDMLAALAKDDAKTLAFGPTTELLAWRGKGIGYGGAVPGEYDVPLMYALAVLRTSPRIEAAMPVASWLAGPSGLHHFRASGVN